MKSASLAQRLSNITTPHYIDNDLALLDDARSLPIGTKGANIDGLSVIVFVRSGYMHLEVNGEIRHVSSRQVLFCRPGQRVLNPSFSEDFSGHAIILTMRYGQSLITVAGNIWNYLLQIDDSPVIEVPDESLERLLSYYQLLWAEARHEGNIYLEEVVSSVMKGFFYSLISDMRRVVTLDKIEMAEVDENFAGSSQALALFNRFISILINEHCTERKIDYYAQRLCVTNKYLSTVCKRVSNRTAHEWINDSIVNGIENYLRYSDKSIKEIAMHYGFTTLSFFSRYVKEHLGVSPSSFRKQ